MCRYLKLSFFLWLTFFCPVLRLQGVTLDGKGEVDGQDIDITRAGEYSPLGMRVILELENMGGLFPFGMYTRAGWRPGFLEENNAFLEFGFVVPLIMIK